MDTQVRAAGMMINSMGWIDGLGYELILHSLKTFRVDIVLVIGQDRLYSQLSNLFRVSLRTMLASYHEGCEHTVLV